MYVLLIIMFLLLEGIVLLRSDAVIKSVSSSGINLDSMRLTIGGYLLALWMVCGLIFWVILLAWLRQGANNLQSAKFAIRFPGSKLNAQLYNPLLWIFSPFESGS